MKIPVAEFWLRTVAGVALLLIAVAAGAADITQLADSDLPVELEADQLSYDRERNIYYASGDVTLVQGEIKVLSQQLEWNQATGELQAEGDVQLLGPEEEMRGRKVSYNLQQGTGTIEGGRFYLRQQNLHVAGEKIERLGENEYRVYDGTLTTCDGEVPSWKFGASQLDVTLGGYAKARNMVFYLSDVPSMYFPYMIYPAKTERESGLLIPGIGYSQKRGFQYSGAYYQVLGLNQDMTFYLDYLSEMGIGKGVEYRYIFAGNNAGEARVYHIDVDQVDGVTVDDERYAFEWQHDGQLPGQVRMVADIKYVSDDDYFSDFGGIAGEYNKDYTQSRLFFARHWGRNNLVGLFRYSQDLLNDDDTELQLLPRITFDTSQQRIAAIPLYYRLETQYSNFWRDEGVSGERLMVRPAIGAHVALGRYLDLAPEVAWRQRYYWGADTDFEATEEGSVELQTRLSLARLQRSYSGGQDSWQHVLYPEISYSYVPHMDQDELPQFDSYDDIDEQNGVEYALVQRLTRRYLDDQQTHRHLDVVYLRFGLLQEFDNNDGDNGVTNLRTELKLQPMQNLAFASDSVYATDKEEWEAFSAEISLHDERGNGIGGRYRYDDEKDLDYAAVKLDIAYLKPVFLEYQQRHNFGADKTLEHTIAAEYRHQCWSVRLAVSDLEDDSSVMLSFSLSGLGSVANDGSTPGGI